MKNWICFVLVGLMGMMMSVQAKGPGGGCGQGGCGKGGRGQGGGGLGGGGQGGGGCGVGVVAGEEEAVVLSMPAEAWLRLWTDEIAARDLYAALDGQTQRRVFENIGRAEVHHRDMIAGLLKRGGHAVPEEPGPGAYGDAEIEAVYAELLAQGGQGELQAFQAGAAFEELDITELERELGREELSDVERQLLTALRDASVRHLRAFRRQIVRLGGAPERTHLSEERLEALLGQ